MQFQVCIHVRPAHTLAADKPEIDLIGWFNSSGKEAEI
jgi:hypothetical protein